MAALSMHTNYASLVTQNTLNQTNSLLTSSMERLSTGLRINSAADDAAGLQISSRLEAQNRGMSVAMRNSQDSISMLQTAEGAMDEMTNISYRMKDLATQAANGSNTQADRDALQAEYTQLSAELSNIYENSNFGGRSLFSGASDDSLANSTLTFQIGSTKAETLELDVQSFTKAIGQTLEANKFAADAETDYKNALDAAFTKASAAAGVIPFTSVNGTTAVTGVNAADLSAKGYTDLADLQAKAKAGTGTAAADLAGLEANAEALTTAAIRRDYAAHSNYGTDFTTATRATLTAAGSSITDQADAREAMGKVSTLIDQLGSARAQFGANINRLEHTITNLGNMSENVAASKGRITDADFAVESSNMTKNQMLMQASTTVLSQTNQLPSMAMSLLR